MSREEKVERHLTAAGVRFEYREDVPVQSIKREVKGAAYQARMLTKLNSDVLDLYASSYRRGDDLPAVVLVPSQKTSGMYDILGGFHRVNAMYQASKKTTDAYVCTVPRVVADRLARSLNTLESPIGSTKQERVAQAKQLITLHGLSIRAAAADQGISISLIEHDINADETTARLKDLGMEVNGLSTAHLSELHGVKNDHALVRLTDIVVRAKLGPHAIRPILAEIKTARTEQAMMDVVNSYADSKLVREQLDRVAGGQAVRYAVTRRSTILFRALATASNALRKSPTPARLGVTESELLQLRRDWTILKDKMEAFLESEAFARPDHQDAGVQEDHLSGVS